MNDVFNSGSFSNSDEALIQLMYRDEEGNRLESLFTPLQSNEPVEQFVRRT
ncbi:hypothetical protein [Trinickia mobilis]|uniref:hypothetical protein n=1 Tax=Trinickia mobilis TaxID=2816356 RepID=UPI001A8ED330|nr:hypothetical protein [Trinickia mobilis]